MKRSDLLFEQPAARVATTPPEMRGLERDQVRLLVSTARGHEHAIFRELPDFLPPGTVLVVNRSGTLPASLPASGRLGPFTLSLCTRYGARLWLAEPRWDASRPGPMPLAAGERFEAAGLPARLVARYPGLPRLWFVTFDGDVELAMALEGKPIRYGYVTPPFPSLAAYQTIFASVPGSAEMPSAGRPFTERVLEDLRRKAITIAPVELHAGVSSLEIDVDGIEPQTIYPEPFHVPAESAALVNHARGEGRPVIAVGTTVIRALETAWDGEEVQPVSGFTRLFVDQRRGVRTVDGLITGFHDPLASHFAMLNAVAGRDLLHTAYAEAAREGYLLHEFGDSHLLLPGRISVRA